MHRYRAGILIIAAVMISACDAEDPDASESPGPPPTSAPPSPESPTTQSRPASPTQAPSTPRPSATVRGESVEFDAATAFETIEHLADEIGPREGTSDAFYEAADDVDDWFTELGYDVDREPVPVPAGNSWGVDVPEGESANIIADPPDFDPDEPYVIIGAHLDTVPQAPGAEDNASGIAVMLELARMAAAQQPPVPVRFIAFGAEEPRGDGDDMHHFGSQQYVADLPDAQSDALVAMVSLDRVGVSAEEVPVCTGGTGTTSVRDALVDAADDAGVPTETCENRASDHWSFEKADLPSARLGSVPFSGYHSPDDVPSGIDTDQLDRVGRIMWSWLQSL